MTDTRRAALGSLKAEVAPTTFIRSPSGCSLFGREGHLVSGMCPAGSPLSRSLLLTALVSALVLTRGQVVGSQASARCAAGGIPAAQC